MIDYDDHDASMVMMVLLSMDVDDGCDDCDNEVLMIVIKGA